MEGLKISNTKADSVRIAGDRAYGLRTIPEATVGLRISKPGILAF
jgi:hypothetical protein